MRKNGLHFLFKEGDQILNRIFDEVADKETLNKFLRKTYGLLILMSLFSTLLVYLITKYMNDTYILVLSATSIVLLFIASFVLSRLNMVSSISFKVWLGIYSILNSFAFSSVALFLDKKAAISVFLFVSGILLFAIILNILFHADLTEYTIYIIIGTIELTIVGLVNFYILKSSTGYLVAVLIAVFCLILFIACKARNTDYDYSDLTSDASSKHIDHEMILINALHWNVTFYNTLTISIVIIIEGMFQSDYYDY